jgi:hypothetical protein
MPTSNKPSKASPPVKLPFLFRSEEERVAAMKAEFREVLDGLFDGILAMGIKFGQDMSREQMRGFLSSSTPRSMAEAAKSLNAGRVEREPNNFKEAGTVSKKTWVEKDALHIHGSDLPVERKVTTAAQLHGRYIGLLNAVSKSDGEKAKAMRVGSGLTKAIKFLEARRMKSRGAKKSKHGT